MTHLKLTSFVRAVAILVLPLCLACSGTPATSADGKPEALSLVWHVPTQANEVSFFLGTPAVAGGVMYLEDGNSVLALDAATGRKLWARSVRQSAIAPARN